MMDAEGPGAPSAPLPPPACGAPPVDPPALPRLRVLSFNVNGLRACLKRLRFTMAQLLDHLNADIVCIQETKLRRSDLDSELACVDGWDSFFCCDTTSSIGYSGTATFARTRVSLPFAAEEGFTGCAALAAAAAGGSNGATAAAGLRASPHPSLTLHFTVEELTELDAEGRVLVTDHGAFVLFNLYGPAITSEEKSEERGGFKMRFCQALELRWRDLLQQGRAVVAVGDFNICPAPVDHADPDPSQHFRPARPERSWLRRLLHGSRAGAADGQPQLPAGGGVPGSRGVPGGGSSGAPGGGSGGSMPGPNGHASSSAGGGREVLFCDTFRHFYPTRTRVATCWSTATNARVLNWGNRIDLILTAGLAVGQPPQHLALAPAAGQQAEQPGGPAGRADGSSQPGLVGGGQGGAPGPSVWVVASEIWPEQEGSDHCPVYADFVSASGAPFPCAMAAPPAAMRHVFVGRQHKLHRWLAPIKPAGSADVAAASASMSSDAGGNGSLPPPVSGQSQQQQQQASPRAGQAGAMLSSQASGASNQAEGGAGAAAEGKRDGKKQASLKSFFQRPAPVPAPAPGQQQQQQEEEEEEEQQQQQQQGWPPDAPQADASPGPSAKAAAAAQAAMEAEAARAAKHRESKDAWAGIMAKNKVPLCRHKEPAKLLRVNKSGPNKGRYFYTCARPEGPQPEGKCQFFKWVEKRPTDHQLTTLTPSGGGGKGSGGGGAPASKRLKA